MIPYEYVQDDAISASDVKTILKNGAEYFYALRRGEIKREKTEALSFGSYFHSVVFNTSDIDFYVVLDKKELGESPNQRAFIAYVLQGEDYETAYRCSYSTEGKSKGKVLEEALGMIRKLGKLIDAYRTGREPISLESVEKAEEMKAALLSYLKNCKKSIFLDIFDSESAIKETPLFGDFDGLRIKGIPDLFDVKDGRIKISDLKTIEHSGVDNCLKNIEDYGYKLSMYWYIWLIAQNFGLNVNETKIECSLMFVSKNKPYNCTEIKFDVKNVKKYLSEYINPVKRMLFFPNEMIELTHANGKIKNKRSRAFSPSTL